MNDLDALIAKTEALVMSTRDELLAAGEDETQLAKFAADLADLHEPTAEEREEFAQIYSIVTTTTNAIPNDRPLDRLAGPSGTLLPGSVPQPSRGQEHLSNIQLQTVLEWFAEAPDTGWASARLRFDEFIKGHRTALDSHMAYGTVPICMTSRRKHASWFNTDGVLFFINPNNWDYDSQRRALLFFPTENTSAQGKQQADHHPTASFAPMVSDDQLLLRLDHELKQAAEEVVEKLRRSLLQGTCHLRRVALRQLDCSDRCDDYAFLRYAIRGSYPDLLTIFNPLEHIDSARIHQAVIKAACGPPDSRTQDIQWPSDRLLTKQANHHKCSTDS